jgi:hypothetical protein
MTVISLRHDYSSNSFALDLVIVATTSSYTVIIVVTFVIQLEVFLTYSKNYWEFIISSIKN